MTAPPTSAESALRDARQARKDLSVAVYADSAAWHIEKLADDCGEHPCLDHPGGLPSGWVLTAHHEFVLWGAAETVLGLVRRDAGGWILAHHTRRHEQTAADTFFVTHAASVPDLSLLIQNDPELGPFREPFRALVAAAYDPTDPVEAGERTLVALGGPILLTPRSLESR